MYTPPTCRTSPNATSSQASVDGRSRFGSLDGQMIDLFGPVPVPANLSARQARELGLLTSGTFGRHSTISSASVSLQRSLESKLQARLGLPGSTVFKLTWKHRATPLGRLICALRASGPITSGSVSTGLPTPSGTSNHGKNHVAGRLDEWGGSSIPFRGTEIGKVHSPGFELWVMGFPAVWRQLMPPAMRSSRKSPRSSSNA